MRTLTTLMLATTLACQTDTTTVTTRLSVTSHALRTESLSLEVYLDGSRIDQTADFGADRTASIQLTDLEPGFHTFQIAILTNAYPTPIELLRSQDRTQELHGGSNEISFGPGDFDLETTANDDTDEVSNWDEFQLGCDPLIPDCPWRSVAVGREHTCAIASNREIYCFGANANDQLGSFGGPSKKTPGVEVPSDTWRWQQVAAGTGHTCAIAFENNEVYCWGDGSAGQLGVNDVFGRDHPVGLDFYAREIAAGGEATCAIDLGGALYCWGRKRGEPEDFDLVPQLVDPGPGWTAVAVGDAHQCGIRDGTVYCRGENSEYQLGDSDPIFHADLSPVSHPFGHNWSTVAAGTNTTCAIDTMGELWCWGDNSEGELGNEDGVPTHEPNRIDVGSESGWHSVSVGEDHVCGAHGTQLECWGVNKQGRLGRSEVYVGDRATPGSLLDDIDAIAYVAAAAHHTCAVRGGQLFCWGAHGFGKTGVGLEAIIRRPSVNTNIPNPGGGNDWAEVSAGENHTCARTVDNDLFCWGDNTYGAIGNDTIIDTSEPQSVSGVWTQVTCGTGFTCAIYDASTLHCWGYNGEGQLANHTTDNAGTPTPVWHPTNAGQAPGGNPWSSVSAGAAHACAVEEDGAGNPQDVYCWGNNATNAVGQGPAGLDSYTEPTGVGIGAYTASAVATGHGYSCLIAAGDSSRYCWGDNDNGELGVADLLERNSPTHNTSDSANGWAVLAGGGDHTCGIVDTSEELQCWGDDGTGQVGNGDPASGPVSTPAAISTGWSTVTAGGSHSCAITTSDQLFCWGNNEYGQLGLDHENEMTTPIREFWAETWLQVSAGGAHTCAIRDSTPAELHCWGSNESGQLGIADNPAAGFAAWATTPQLVSR